MKQWQLMVSSKNSLSELTHTFFKDKVHMWTQCMMQAREGYIRKHSLQKYFNGLTAANAVRCLFVLLKKHFIFWSVALKSWNKVKPMDSDNEKTLRAVNKRNNSLTLWWFSVIYIYSHRIFLLGYATYSNMPRDRF